MRLGNWNWKIGKKVKIDYMIFLFVWLVSCLGDSLGFDRRDKVSGWGCNVVGGDLLSFFVVRVEERL